MGRTAATLTRVSWINWVFGVHSFSCQVVFRTDKRNRTRNTKHRGQDVSSNYKWERCLSVSIIYIFPAIYNTLAHINCIHISEHVLLATLDTQQQFKKYWDTSSSAYKLSQPRGYMFYTANLRVFTILLQLSYLWITVHDAGHVNEACQRHIFECGNSNDKSRHLLDFPGQ